MTRITINGTRLTETQSKALEILLTPEILQDMFQHESPSNLTSKYINCLESIHALMMKTK